MSDLPFKHAIVTGASSGIGAALAHRLVQEGVSSMALVARRGERLRQLASALAIPCEIIEADLSTEAGIERVTSTVTRTDLLVNNAGFGSFGPFHTLDAAKEGSMVRLNCMAPVALARHYIPDMVEHGSGGVLNIASGQSFQAMPYMSTYAATKAFLLHWSEGVRAELRGSGVRVVTVCPGAIATEFNSAADIPDKDLGAMSLVTGSLDGVIDAAIDGLARDQGIKVPGIRNYLATAAGRFSPRSTSAWFLALLLRKAARRAAEPSAR